MARAKFQVLVFPYRRSTNGALEFCLFKRVDNQLWQGVAGGGEDDETPLEAARRETAEEAGISASATLITLDSVESIPAEIFSAKASWGEDVFVIPQYSFGIQADELIAISHEHTEFGWFSYEQAISLMRYDGDKTALWELRQRLEKRSA